MTEGEPDVGPAAARVAPRVRILRDMGLLEVIVDPEGRQVHRLSPEGMRIGHTLAIVNGENARLRALPRKPTR